MHIRSQAGVEVVVVWGTEDKYLQAADAGASASACLSASASAPSSACVPARVASRVRTAHQRFAVSAGAPFQRC